MQIKFVELLQQSWNFMRNQRSFSLYAIGSLAISQFLMFLVFNDEAMLSSTSSQANMQIDISVLLSALLPSILIAIINLWISVLIILDIQSINNGQYQHFFQNTNGAFKAFFPILLLTFLMVLPISFGASLLMASSNTSLLALPLIAIGFYIFIKLSLVIYVYLLEKPQKTIVETLKFTMQLSRGKMLPLILFLVLSSFVPNILASYMMLLGNEMIGILLRVMISSAITVFISVFSFRFYQVYRNLPTMR